MPTKVGTSNIASEETETKNGSELVRRAREDGGIEEESFGILFTSTNLDVEKLVKDIDEEINSEWIGGTTIAEISHEGPAKGSAVFMLIESDEMSFESIRSGKISEDAEDAASMAAKKVEKAADQDFDEELLFSLIPGLTMENDGREFKYLKGLEKHLDKSIKVVGGSTGDGHRLIKNFQIINGEIYEDRAVMAVIQSNLEIATGQAHGYEKSVTAGMITESDGRLVKEISGKPALKFYSEATDAPERELSKIYDTDLDQKIKAGLYYLNLKLRGKDPSMVHQILSHSLDYSIAREIRPEEYRILSPLEVKGQSIKMMDEIEEGQTVKILEGDRDSIIGAAEEAFSQMDPESTVFGIIADCASRHLLLDQEERAEEVDSAVGRLGDKFIGLYGEGEIGGGENGICTYMSQTVTGFAVKRPEKN